MKMEVKCKKNQEPRAKTVLILGSWFLYLLKINPKKVSYGRRAYKL